MQSLHDSLQWAAMSRIDPTYAERDSNLYIILVADGVNPYRNQNFTHSMWPILLVIFNLPPWLALPKFFVSLTLLILGKKAPSVTTFNIFLTPLVGYLQTLWAGVLTWDASPDAGSHFFVLRAMLLMTINALLAYGLVSSQQMKGYRSCLLCVTKTNACHSSILGKMVYLRHRRYLCTDHWY